MDPDITVRNGVEPGVDSSARPPQAPKPKRNPKLPRQKPKLLDSAARCSTGREVALGFSDAQVRVEVLRCLNCKDPKCVDACPLHIDIKAFMSQMVDGDYAVAFDTISRQNPFPGICGRVCQHELYCEKACLLGSRRPSWSP